MHIHKVSAKVQDPGFRIPTAISAYFIYSFIELLSTDYWAYIPSNADFDILKMSFFLYNFHVFFIFMETFRT